MASALTQKSFWDVFKGSYDIILAVAVVLIIAMMIIPLPAILLDILLTINIALSIMIMLIAIYTDNPLKYSTFPTVLLVATLYRLSLNICSTRLILLNGEAGEVIHAFGNFVVGGNYVVGVLIFIILVIINFIVITNGSGRVSEVAARFTLDAMPGKQLSIDADLNAGLITETEAKERRKKIENEADFYGTMDGASKFVKGDAIAGIVITIVNIIGGLIIGTLQQGKTIEEAAALYTLLTVGDGLVTQLPALLISAATGIIVTRAASKGTSLGENIKSEMFTNYRILGIISVLMLCLGILPGMPTLPFVVLGSLIGYAAFKVKKQDDTVKQDEDKKLLDEKSSAKKKSQKATKETILDLLAVEPMELEIGYRLVPLLDAEQGGDLLDRIGQIRRQTALDLGFVLPSIRVRDNLQLSPNDYQIKIRGTVIETGEVIPDKLLAMGGDISLGIINGVQTKEPAFGLPALWITKEDRENAEVNGFTVVSPSAVISTHLTEVVKKYADEILTRSDVSTLIENIKPKAEQLVEETISDNRLSLGEVHLVLQNLLKERVSIKDLTTILETLSTHVRINKNLDFLTEQTRLALSRSITKNNLSQDNTLYALTLDPSLEQNILNGISEDGKSLSFDPTFIQNVIMSVSGQLEHAINKSGHQPVLLCSGNVRLPLRRLLERSLPQLNIMSYNEVTQNINAKSVGLVKV